MGRLRVRSAAAALLGGTVLIAGAWLAGTPPLEGQAGGATRWAAAVEPDSIRVGEAFTVGITVIRESPGEVAFPALLELPDALEQRGPVRVRSLEEGTEWRAYYTLVAWSADSLALPPVELAGVGASGGPLAVRLPTIAVRSVLPAGGEEVELRDAKPFLRARSFPWWAALIAAALLALGWWAWRRRRPRLERAVPLGPGGYALREFERLREAWLEGRLSGDRFYDGYEAALRRYAGATRGWPPGRGLASLGRESSDLVTALRRSLLARFARVRPRDEGPLSDLEAGASFVRSEMPEEPSDADDDARGDGAGAGAPDGTGPVAAASDGTAPGPAAATGRDDGRSERHREMPAGAEKAR